MRATKADVDAFNAAKLTAAEFEKKITISVYEAGGGNRAENASTGSAQGITGHEHVVQAGETLSSIVHAYAARGVSVTLDDVLKANPGLRPERLRVGQKIFIPGS